MVLSSSVTERASSGKSVEMGDAAQARGQFGFEVELEQAEHLRVTVLFDDVDAIVLLDEFVHLAGERIGAQAQVVGLDAVFVTQLVAAFDYAPVRSAVGDDTDLCIGEPAFVPLKISGRGTKERAVSNLRLRRSILFS